ncbi:alpha/beta hydrolase [Georgenia yuyongxinii]|uniref:Alpha/beta hydrolase n=1 Tax=Georgenia yuyongxinii TaxID=2589797 RepID=A0A5B8C5E3_9MICO|nr:alpha/beta hydrolase [Georgenia yuyongxinii]QDC24591.1 alpha/beta hydrolase [Georgenia yuyongxinii]
MILRARLGTGVTLTCADLGDRAGIPVLLLHAWGESRGVFDRVVPLLPPALRLLVPDQRGHGEADKPADGYALSSLAADAAALLDAVGVPAAVVVGSSSGGYVAQQLALEHPDRVSGLVLVGAPRSLHTRPAFADEVDRLTEPVGEAWVRASLAWFPTFDPIPDDYLVERVADGARIPAHVWREALAGLLDAVPPTEAGAITAPTLVIWGDLDEILPRREQEALTAAIPGARLTVYEETGHLVLWEAPERVAADLARFIASIGR